MYMLGTRINVYLTSVVLVQCEVGTNIGKVERCSGICAVYFYCHLMVLVFMEVFDYVKWFSRNYGSF